MVAPAIRIKKVASLLVGHDPSIEDRGHCAAIAHPVFPFKIHFQSVQGNRLSCYAVADPDKLGDKAHRSLAYLAGKKNPKRSISNDRFERCPETVSRELQKYVIDPAIPLIMEITKQLANAYESEHKRDVLAERLAGVLCPSSRKIIHRMGDHKQVSVPFGNGGYGDFDLSPTGYYCLSLRGLAKNECIAIAEAIMSIKEKNRNERNRT